MSGQPAPGPPPEPAAYTEEWKRLVESDQMPNDARVRGYVFNCWKYQHSLRMSERQSVYARLRRYAADLRPVDSEDPADWASLRTWQRAINAAVEWVEHHSPPGPEK